MSQSSVRLDAPSPKHAVALVEAGFCQCRFIISEDEPRAICCGAPTNGGSWCDWHRGIVYEAARERSPKPRDRQLAHRAA